ncbi:MAG: ATP-binding protein [Treponema sp.]|nr:ATP-binding protein [Treponema sp.]
MIAALKTRLFPVSGKDANVMQVKAQTNEMGILDHIEKIVELSKENGIDGCLDDGQDHLDYIAGKLGISPLQAALFAHFMESGTDIIIGIGDIAEALKCSKLRMIKYTNDCEELERKKLIRCRRDGNSVMYRVPRDVIDSIRKHNEFRPRKDENLGIEQFFDAIERIFDERENDELTPVVMREELLDLMNQNTHLAFCKTVKRHKLFNEDLMVLLRFCHLFANNNDDNISSHDISLLYGNSFECRRVSKYLSNGSHHLMEMELIEHANSDGFVRSESWKLSEKAKKEFLFELDLQENRCKKDLVMHDDIKAKKMFYNSRETADIEKLTSLLQEENYRRIQERLEGKGMRKGFACLFSGGPGTGKTETAYQIARQTKRNIMMVDISEIKSMWYGESEKKIKEIFDTYRATVDSSAIAPILLFNEADAIIGRRKEFSRTGRSSIDQTENTIQNIILQEMENLSGILIATTNLAQNMDGAFERRFLYKIVFDKPGAESRKGIWQAMLPDLPMDNVGELSGRFELSGGQIENIARKVEVDDIINGGGLSMDTLVRYCKDELQSSLGACEKRIGFSS